MNPRAALALALALAGCPSRPAVVVVPPPIAAARFVVPSAQARGEGARGAVTITPDGVVTRDGARVATVTPREITDAHGAALATLGADGTIRVTGSSRSLRIVDDALVRDDGVRASRAEQGAIVLRDREGALTPGPWRIDTVSPIEGAPTVILTLLLLDGPVPAAQ